MQEELPESLNQRTQKDSELEVALPLIARVTERTRLPRRKSRIWGFSRLLRQGKSSNNGGR